MQATHVTIVSSERNLKGLLYLDSKTNMRNFVDGVNGLNVQSLSEALTSLKSLTSKDKTGRRQRLLVDGT
jgi:hypothetical protein